MSVLSILTGMIWISDASAQSVAECQLPETDQYSLLVDGQTPEEQRRLEQVLPSSATITPCMYRNQLVIQVSTFEDEALAQSWAEYLTDVEEFETIVARNQTPSSEAGNSTGTVPPTNGTSPNFPQPTTTPSSNPGSSPTSATPVYAPATLEPGYAVLVRYDNRPEIAAAVQSALNAPVGLAVYEQQPYLIVAYSTDPAIAGQVLQGLSDRRFGAFIVSSQRVVVLSSSIIVPQ
ncbi:MAG: hypothetical protein AAGA75_17465 [Cyanobacteria bacterium P01_E01_bin.6]